MNPAETPDIPRLRLDTLKRQRAPRPGTGNLRNDFWFDPCCSNVVCIGRSSTDRTLSPRSRQVLTAQIRIDRQTGHVWAALPPNVDMEKAGFECSTRGSWLNFFFFDRFSRGSIPPKVVFVPKEYSLATKHGQSTHWWSGLFFFHLVVGDWVALLLSAARPDGLRIGRVVTVLANAAGKRVEIVPLIDQSLADTALVQFESAMDALVEMLISDS